MTDQSVEAMTEQWKKELYMRANPAKTDILSRFFKTGPGEYGEGDIFIGLSVPDNRAVSRHYAQAPLETIGEMLDNKVHEYRLGALLALVARYRKHPAETVEFYLRNLHKANNWDLIDLSAPYILGEELRQGRHHDTLRRMTASPDLWTRRASVVATLRPIMKDREISLALENCSRLVSDPHQLMQKAVGWVLRETGKKDHTALVSFLEGHISILSATTLSYATEKFSPAERLHWRRLRKAR